jgi:hypothetical protein
MKANHYQQDRQSPITFLAASDDCSVLFQEKALALIIEHQSPIILLLCVGLDASAMDM